MPGFVKDTTARTPFGKNQYLRSTKDNLYESATFGKNLIPTATIDTYVTKVLQPGTLLAKATSGPDTGKVGVFMAGVTDGRQTAANIVGICDTFLPWQLTISDRNVAYLYRGTVYQAFCFEYNAGGAAVALTNATRDAILALANKPRIIFT
jgi:hypothetical protein